jgi:thiol-disulfide isomerase/thioredoxin
MPTELPCRFLPRPLVLLAAQLAALGLMAAGCSRVQHDPASGGSGRPAPSADSAGGDVKLLVLSFEDIQQLISSQKGKVVVLDCWSTSCEPCMKEFPGLVALHRKYGPDRVACISLSFDYEGLGKPEDVQQPVLDFLRQQQATFTNVLCSDESDLLYDRLELASIPAVFVYNQQGKLVKRFTTSDPSQPAFTYRDVQRLVEQLLAG